MPVSVSQLWRKSECEVPTVGTVTLEDASLATVAEATKAANEASEVEQPSVFSNHLLSSMLVEPRLDAAAVAALPGDAIEALINCAVDMLGLRQEFNALAGDVPVREKLYEAQTQYYVNLNKRILSSFRPVVPNTFGPLYGNVLTDAAKGILGFDKVATELRNSMQLMSGLHYKLLQPDLPNGFLGLGENISPMSTFAASIQRITMPSREQIREFSGIAESIRLLTDSPLVDLTAKLVETRLPEPFLSDALISTGLNSSFIHTPTYPLPVVEPIDDEDEIERHADEAIRERLVGAYDTLLLLETRLRRLVEAKLTEVHGSTWWKRGVPKPVRDQCLQRKQERESPDSLRHNAIDYTFIGELKDVILRGDNWRDTFAQVFQNEHGTVETMFLWIEPARKDVAHPRDISDDEYQQFTVAANWLLRAINRSMS